MLAPRKELPNIYVLQTTHMCVASETDRGEPTLECINFIATQINVQQTTQIMSQAKLVGARYNLMCRAPVIFAHIKCCVANPLLLYSTSSKYWLEKNIFEIVLEGSFGTIRNMGCF